MELGEKLRQERVKQGISQRQLCGDMITRNMLSMIENGSAAPSLDTLRYLSDKLGKPMGYFLETEQVGMPNLAVIKEAKVLYQSGDMAATLRNIEGYSGPDSIFDDEKNLLEVLTSIKLAEQMIDAGNIPYAQALLERASLASVHTIYYTDEIERRRLLALSRIIPMVLPPNDAEFLLRAQSAYHIGDYIRAEQYLNAVECKEETQWNYLMGMIMLKCEKYNEALSFLRKGWDHAPKTCAFALECCCRALEDFRGAYEYACLQRDLK